MGVGGMMGNEVEYPVWFGVVRDSITGMPMRVWKWGTPKLMLHHHVPNEILTNQPKAAFLLNNKYTLTFFDILLLKTTSV